MRGEIQNIDILKKAVWQPNNNNQLVKAEKHRIGSFGRDCLAASFPQQWAADIDVAFVLTHNLSPLKSRMASQISTLV
jgi:hypothetical protein